MPGKEAQDHRIVVGTVLGPAGSTARDREPLADALERVRGFAPELLDEQHAALVEAFARGHESVELAESAVLLGLADRALAERRGLDVLGYGLWAARAHQRAGRPERAIELADVMAGAGVLSSELTAVQGECIAAERQRRRRRDQELLYARRALATEQPDQARHHLERVLEVEPDHAEAAQMLASLEEFSTTSSRTGARAWVVFVGFLALGLPVGAVSMAHTRAVAEYESFARPVPADLLAIERRIGELERFADEHPLWWGGARLEREITDLNRTRDAIEFQLRQKNEQEDQARAQSLAQVESVYLDARTAVEAGRPRAALVLLEDALAGGVPSATMRARLRRDIAAIRELLSEGGGNPDGPDTEVAER